MIRKIAHHTRNLSQKSFQYLGGWVPIAFITTMLFGGVYLSFQHYNRAMANMPQIQVAHDTADQLYRGQPLPATEPTVIISNSLAPFTVLYDAKGVAVGGNGRLPDNSLPQIPVGVLEYAKSHEQHVVTWQPNSYTRIAAVVRYYHNEHTSGYVLAGRNLWYVEHVDLQIMLALAAMWLATIGGSYWLSSMVRKR